MKKEENRYKPTLSKRNKENQTKLTQTKRKINENHVKQNQTKQNNPTEIIKIKRKRSEQRKQLYKK